MILAVRGKEKGTVGEIIAFDKDLCFGTSSISILSLRSKATVAEQTLSGCETGQRWGPGGFDTEKGREPGHESLVQEEMP